MPKDILKIALRNITKQKQYTLINVSGLAIGLACCILINMWIQDELGYDKFHENGDHIYRVVEEKKIVGADPPDAMTPGPLAPTLKSEYPNIQKASRVRTIDTWGWSISYQQRTFIEEGICFVDADFFEMFSFPLVEGDYNALFDDPNSILVSEEMVEKYFGEADPIGEMMNIEGRRDLTVVGIIADAPTNTHISFDFVLSFSLYEKLGRSLDDWDDCSYYTYVQVDEYADVSSLTQDINNCIGRNVTESASVYLPQPLEDVHLYSSHLAWDVGGQGNITYIYAFSALAALILLSACVNFMSLSTARSSIRAKEIGIRKIVGASRASIALRFLGESLVLSLCSLCFAVLLVELSLTQFNELTGKSFTIGQMMSQQALMGLFLITCATGIIAGSYPAVFMSSLQPTKVLKRSLNNDSARSGFRRLLVVFQFTITTILITGTLVIFDQVGFIQDKRLGFDKDNVFYVEIGRSMRPKVNAIVNELKQHSSITGIGGSSNPMTRGMAFAYDDYEWEGKPQGKTVQMNTEVVTHEFLRTLGMRIIEGRDFSSDGSRDIWNVILNEAAVKAMGIDSPLGRKFRGPVGREGEIIGVVKDYNYKSLHQRVEPLVIACDPTWITYLYFRVIPDRRSSAIETIATTLKKHAPDDQSELLCLNHDYDFLYKSEKQILRFISLGAILAIFTSCLGLLGMISYGTEQRKREVGVRKVLGASVLSVMRMFTQELIILVAIANLIAWPIAYYLINRWLESFAFRTSIEISIFILAGFITLVIALVTVVHLVTKAALANPVEAIGYE